MRKLVLVLFAAALLSACKDDATAPSTNNTVSLAAQTSGDSTGYGQGFGFFAGGLAGLGRLPDNLKLTADQQTRIRAALQ